MTLEELLKNLKDLTQNRIVSVKIGYYKAVGFMAVGVDHNGQNVPETALYGFVPTLDEAISQLGELITAYGASL